MQPNSVLACVSDLDDPAFFADVDLVPHPLFSTSAMPSEPAALMYSAYVELLDELTNSLGRLVTSDNY